ncbi:hypothetical protein CEE45_10165 [Candidatus Heimdallarchaeota archaeon B3_Heim]|nr:MAG: hypothetical protein CEE45_10165 [Candidatus Heimdallarchaeota archaeon B3_Heim]
MEDPFARKKLEKIDSKTGWGKRVYYVLYGSQDEDFCDKCKKTFSDDEYNIYSDISECCYCLPCFFKGFKFTTLRHLRFFRSLSPK